VRPQRDSYLPCGPLVRDVIRTFDGIEPQIAESAYVDDAAVVVGDVVVEAEASVWPNTTLRGDSGQVVVGAGANVQDNAVLHEEAVLEPGTTVGHGAIVHAATVAEGALVGMGAVVLDGAHVGEDAVVGAGAVVTEGTDVPPATLVTGTPAEPTADLEDPPSTAPADYYTALARRHEETSERVD
jgi:carbonic anhydrase/acetyltransferase-like protein (isoleucine patch superfamily)